MNREVIAIQYLIILLPIIVYAVTQLSNLDSTISNDKREIENASHLIQILIAREQMANEKVIYTWNITIGSVFLAIIGVILVATCLSLPTVFGIVYSVSMVATLIITNLIVDRIDVKYDDKWLKAHKHLFQQSAKEK